jgi:superfamily II DNA/RNA helicase
VTNTLINFKLNYFLEIAKKHCGTSKTVVLCNTKEEVGIVSHLLKKYARNLLIAHESMDQFEIASKCHLNEKAIIIIIIKKEK